MPADVILDRLEFREFDLESAMVMAEKISLSPLANETVFHEHIVVGRRG